jgi:O-antigen/teichoic acid export membrane protein
VDLVASPASNVMMVRMGEEIRDNRNHSLLPIWHDVTRKLAFVFFPVVGLLLVSAHALIPFLFTAQFSASVPIFMVWSLSLLFSAFQTDGVMRVFAQTRFIFVMNLVRLVLVVSVMNLFLTHFHLVGAVLVTLIGLLTAKSMALLKIKSLLGTTVSQLLPWKNLAGILFAAMLSMLPAALLTTELRQPGLLNIVVVGMLYMFAYFSLVVIFRLLTPVERRAIGERLVRYVPVLARGPQ